MISSDLPYTPIAEKSFQCRELSKLHTQLRIADNEWRKSRHQQMPYDHTRALCNTYIKLSYMYQEQRWGRVRARMHPSHLMR